MKKTCFGLALLILLVGAYSSLADTNDDAVHVTPLAAEDQCQSAPDQQSTLPAPALGEEIQLADPCLMECRQDLADCREDGNPVSVCRANLLACQANC